MTQAAVSYQIRQIEDRVGAQLFQRLPKGVQLTPMGARFAAHVTEAFDLLRTGFSEARRDLRDTLVINALPSFAMSILAPRLGKFQLEHPNISTRVDIDNLAIDLPSSAEPTVGLRSGKGVWPGLVAHRIMAMSFSPMFSPALLEQHGPVRQPEDLLRFPMIDEHDQLWSLWFWRAGVAKVLDENNENAAHLYGMQVMEANAVINSQGMALLTPNFFRPELERGALVQPFDLECDIGLSIWLVYPKQRRRSPAIQAFREWLIAEIARDFPDALLDASNDSP